MKKIAQSLKIAALSAIVFTFARCQNEAPKEAQQSPSETPAIEQNNAKVDAHNSRNSLDWSGIYSGVLPCGDCEGIETTLRLNNDETFELITVYLGTPEANEFKESGDFVWDEKGEIIELKDLEFDTKKYKVLEGAVLQLDQNGEVISGDLAENYRLRKQ